MIMNVKLLCERHPPTPNFFHRRRGNHNKSTHSATHAPVLSESEDALDPHARPHALCSRDIAAGDRACRQTVPAGLTLDHTLPEKVDLSTRLANKKVILLGLPGAFTPT